MVSKYENTVWEILSFEEIKSTQQVLEELEKKSHKVINWYAVYKILRSLKDCGKVELLEAKGGLFWRKK